jgi:hypothetical protein
VKERRRKEAFTATSYFQTELRRFEGLIAARNQLQGGPVNPTELQPMIGNDSSSIRVINPNLRCQAVFQ